MNQPTLFPVHDRGHGQTAGEDYYTPEPLARFCLDLLPWKGVQVVAEGHAGGGAFVRQLLHRGLDVRAWDLDPTCLAVQSGLAVQGSFLDVQEKADRVVGNPPFSAAESHVDHALTLAPECAYLLPAGRTDAQERCGWYQTRPLRHVWLLAERVWPGSRQIGFFWFDKTWPHSWWAQEVIKWKI